MDKIFFNGNIVVIGDVNSGAEVISTGNIVILGELKGRVHAGFKGNDKTIIAKHLNYLQKFYR